MTKKMKIKTSYGKIISIMITSLILISNSSFAGEELVQIQEVYEIKSPIVETLYNYGIDSTGNYVNIGILNIYDGSSYVDLLIAKSFNQFDVLNSIYSRMKVIEKFFESNPNGCIKVENLGGEDITVSIYVEDSCLTDHPEKIITLESVKTVVFEYGEETALPEELINIGEPLAPYGDPDFNGEKDPDLIEEEPTEGPPGRIVTEECPINSWGIPYRDVVDDFMNDPEVIESEDFSEDNEFVTKKLHEGVYYKKQYYDNHYLTGPKRNYIHTFKMDLDYIELYVTPYRNHKMTTTTFFQTAYDLFGEGYRTVDLALDFAINGDGFDRYNAPYPIRGPHISTVYTGGRYGWVQRVYSRTDYPALKIYNDGSVDIGKLEKNYENILYAVGGIPQLIEEGCMWDRCVNGGNIWEDNLDRFTDFQPNARTAVGVDKQENVLIIIIAEGDDAKRKGMNFRELACLFYVHGATDALNLDGGGSTTLVTKDGLITQDMDGKIDLIVNSNGDHPRPEQVKNHLGIRFKEPDEINQ